MLRDLLRPAGIRFGRKRIGTDIARNRNVPVPIEPGYRRGMKRGVFMEPFGAFREPIRADFGNESWNSGDAVLHIPLTDITPNRDEPAPNNWGTSPPIATSNFPTCRPGWRKSPIRAGTHPGGFCTLGVKALLVHPNGLTVDPGEAMDLVLRGTPRVPAASKWSFADVASRHSLQNSLTDDGMENNVLPCLARVRNRRAQRTVAPWPVWGNLGGHQGRRGMKRGMNCGILWNQPLGFRESIRAHSGNERRYSDDAFLKIPAT